MSIETELNRLSDFDASLKSIKSDVNDALVLKNSEPVDNLKQIASRINSLSIGGEDSGSSSISMGSCNISVTSLFGSNNFTIAPTLDAEPKIVLIYARGSSSTYTSPYRWHCLYCKTMTTSPIIFGNEDNTPKNSPNGLVINSIDTNNKIVINARLAFSGSVSITEWIAVL